MMCGCKVANLIEFVAISSTKAFSVYSRYIYYLSYRVYSILCVSVSDGIFDSYLTF